MSPQFKESRKIPQMSAPITWQMLGAHHLQSSEQGGHVILKFQVKKVKLKETKALL